MFKFEAFGYGLNINIAGIISAAAFVALGFGVLLFPMVKILKRAGYSGWWVLLLFFPVLNLIGLWWFSLAPWPALHHAQASDQPPSPKG